jgi:hypothetical protein
MWACFLIGFDGPDCLRRRLLPCSKSLAVSFANQRPARSGTELRRATQGLALFRNASSLFAVDPR